MRRILGPKREDVTAECRTQHNEKLNDLYCSPNIIGMIKQRRIKRAGHIARMGVRRDACKGLVGKPEGKRPLRSPRLRWEDNIKMELQKVGWGSWTCLIWLRIGTSGGLF
jgi:hypothetical protein